MEWRDHTHWVGCIVTNLQALETVLRRFLLEVHGQQIQFPKVGEPEAIETYLTNWLSLDALVRYFNNDLKEAEKKFSVDETVVVMRDDNEFPARLWKFGLARDGRFPVELVPSRIVLEFVDAISGISRVPSQAARSIG